VDQADFFGDAGLAGSVIAGVDEAGRGPLAGAVYAAAVILHADRPILGLADSKVLKAAERDTLADEIRLHAAAWCIARAEVEEIDRLNILRATFLAMDRAVRGLQTAPHLALVDGNQAPPLSCAVKTYVKGDALIPSISAASIPSTGSTSTKVTARPCILSVCASTARVPNIVAALPPCGCITRRLSRLSDTARTRALPFPL